ncbi:GntR family transcriptional regulator [Lentilactobacillus fungorum]|uniref:GntR family transcriptional regulator n=1 Tax=Lentilactobacillus fungorum TaxID=2201250 RepID=A0ABQ3VXQ4_9LACO|nr:GntR family transcriptional regulator [Lentilactobacillus fungorum]GHP13077.1 GntR family transcriptional regulator [Lentilactobacillus fungorum]
MPSLQDKTYQIIYSQIMALTLRPGQQVSDRQFEEQLGVSRTPVREAMLRLKRDHLLYSMPQSGTYVTKINLKNALDARFVRQTLEKTIVSTVANEAKKSQIEALVEIVNLQNQAAIHRDINRSFNLDNDFHRKLYEFADKATVWDWQLTFSTDLNRYRLLRVHDNNLPLSLLTHEHGAIIQALINHDARQAEKLIYDHLDLMLNEQQSVVEKFPNYFKNINNLYQSHAV